MSYLDIAFLGIIVLGALLGLWMGFFKSLISFGGWVVAFLLAFFMTSPIVGALLDIAKVKTFVVGNGTAWSLYNWIYLKLPDLSSGFWSKLFKSLIDISQAVASDGMGDLKVNVSLLIANGVFSTIIFLALLIVIRALLLLLTMFANAMAKDKMKGTSNRVFGMLVGLVKGCGFSVLLMVILTFIMGLGIMAPVRSQLDKSVITAPVYTQVSNITDKVMTGGRKRLEFLLHAGGFDRDQADKPNEEIDYDKYAGSYTATQTQEGNEFDWTLTLNSDKNKTFKLTSVYALDEDAEESNQGSGTYRIERDGDNMILVLNFDDGRTSKNSIGDDYIDFSGMHMLKQ